MSYARVWTQIEAAMTAKNVIGQPDHAAPREPAMKRYSKAIAAVLGTAAMVVSAGVLEENTEIVVNAVLAIATALGVYSVPNRPAQTPTV